MVKRLRFFQYLYLILWNFSAQVYCQNTQRLWFDTAAIDWNHALPVGNGRLGAMIYGGALKERIQLNEQSVWLGQDVDFVNPLAKEGLQEVRNLLFAGKYVEAEKLAQQKLMCDKKIPSTYQTLGDLQLEFSQTGNISDYYRDLDLETAIAGVSYKVKGVAHKREIFASAPDQALVIHFTVSQKGALNFTCKMLRPESKATVTIKNNEIMLTEHVGEGNGVKLCARLKLLTDGKVVVKESGIALEHASTATLYITAATNYRGENPEEVSRKQLEAVLKKPYDLVKKQHIEDYQQYFKRVSFGLGTSKAIDLPTNKRLHAVQNGADDPQLIALYYQFGRYLLISSSRPGGMPANLQGLWADGMWPPWNADYHININIQMNYWPSEITNLSEMHEPFLKFVDELRPNARRTAKEMYGMEGAVGHFSTDAWHYAEPWGQTDWAMWPMGYAWSATHLWEHYLFTEDQKYLKELAYPALKDGAKFCVNWLVENPKTGRLVSGPSISPENKFITAQGEVASMVMGPTMDQMIIRDLLSATIKASEILQIDLEFRTQMQQTLAKLSPTQIASDGRIMEWTEEFKEENPGHRHISHLYGLHPANQISSQTPELLEAARKTLAHRLANGGGHTGWSRAWIINFFARLQDGEAAHQNLVALLQKSTLDNLFDNHPPFQIDGNFGATAGITEMLLQSHAGEILLLPALPKAWPKGHIKGIVARGGFEVEMYWEGGQLTKLVVLSHLGNGCILRLGTKTITVKTEKGKTYVFGSGLSPQ